MEDTAEVHKFDQRTDEIKDISEINDGDTRFAVLYTHYHPHPGTSISIIHPQVRKFPLSTDNEQILINGIDIRNKNNGSW